MNKIAKSALDSLALILTMVSLLACLPSVFASGTTDTMKAKQILDTVDDLYRGTSSEGTMTMTIVTRHWKRTLSLAFWTKGKDKSLIRILSPKKEKGTATLRSGNEIWNYLPKVKRVIKLPSSMMSSSWMGSHFTNDDLVKESRFTEDYDFTITYRGPRNNEQVIEITCIPKPQAAIVWGKVVVVVRQSDYLPLLARYFDEDLNLARTLSFSAIRDMGGRRIPVRLVVKPAFKPGEYTEMVYNSISFNIPLDDETFSLRNLQR